MKRILLSVMTFVALAIGANAAEPTYTAVGTVGTAEGWEAYTALSTGLTGLPVEVYGTDSVIVRRFGGFEGYDLVVVLGEDSDIASYHQFVNGKYSLSMSYGYVYLWTGEEQDNETNSTYCYWLSNQTGWAQWDSDETTKTGGITAYGYAYAPEESSVGYWHISWAPEDTGISKYIADPETSKSSATFNLSGQRVSSDSKGLVIRNGKKMVVR